MNQNLIIIIRWSQAQSAKTQLGAQEPQFTLFEQVEGLVGCGSLHFSEFCFLQFSENKAKLKKCADQHMCSIEGRET